MIESSAFDFDTPLARRSDPQSSHAAAERVRPMLKGQRSEIFDAVAAHPGRTAVELEQFCSLSGHQIGKRVGEMRDHDLLEEVRRNKLPSVWYVVPQK